MRSDTKTAAIKCRLQEPTLQALDQIAANNGVGRSQIIREALRDYIARQTGAAA